MRNPRQIRLHSKRRFKNLTCFLLFSRYADVNAILNFMYHGEVNVNQEDLPNFLAAAEELRIRGLSEKMTGSCNDEVGSGSHSEGGAEHEHQLLPASCDIAMISTDNNSSANHHHMIAAVSSGRNKNSKYSR